MIPYAPCPPPKIIILLTPLSINFSQFHLELFNFRLFCFGLFHLELFYLGLYTLEFVLSIPFFNFVWKNGQNARFCPEIKHSGNHRSMVL